MGMKIQHIKTATLLPHDDNPRKGNLGDLSELAESIRKQGVLQNLTVVPWESNDEFYEVVIGHRRLAAAQKAGIEEVPCVVADMSRMDQVATIMAENRLRLDFLPLEEAAGFQTMMDMGGTVQSIAESTGFSDDTVRRRLKILEMDRKLLEEVQGRDAKISDYIRLGKIKDIGQRNKVLESIGTKDFEWNLGTALERESREEKISELAAQAGGFATEITGAVNWGEVEFFREYYYSKAGHADVEIPEDADEREYFYRRNDYSVSLYRARVDAGEGEAEVPAAARERQERQERQEELERRIRGLKEAANRAYGMRRDFMLGLPPTKIKRHYPRFIQFMAVNFANSGSYFSFDTDVFGDVLDVTLDEKCEDHAAAKKNYLDLIAAVAGEVPERALMAMAYSSAEDDETNAFSNSYNNIYRENEHLDRLYDFLSELGYGISTEESALRDGTHELFAELEDGKGGN